MSEILVMAEHLNGVLLDISKELVTAARQLGGRLTVGVAGGPDGEGVAAQAAAIEGVDRVVRVDDGPDTTGFDHDRSAQALRALIEKVSPEAVLLGWSIRSASYVSAVAETLDLPMVADAIALVREGDGTLVATRPMYAGKVHAELVFVPEVPVLAMLRPGVWSPAEVAAQGAPIEPLDVPSAGASRVRHLEYIEPAPGVDLAQADIIFAIGRGVGSEENVAVFSELAERLGVGLASSRPLVDVGWLPSAHQVGQTGMTVKPKVYVAFGISGALQHVAGMKESKTVVAVNTDPNAPIFGIADVRFNADILEVAAQMRDLV